MKILADYCVPPSVVETLRKKGIFVIRLKEVGLAKLSDEGVFNYAVKNSLILLTFDHDFGNTQKFNIRKSQGVVIFYVKGLSRETIIERITNFFSKVKDAKLKELFLLLIQAGKLEYGQNRKECHPERSEGSHFSSSSRG